MDLKGVSAHWGGMKATYLFMSAALTITMAVAACASSGEPLNPAPAATAETSAASTPAPQPSANEPQPAPEPTPVVNEPEYANYLDAPQTPGTWEFEDEPSEKLALFGINPRQPIFLIRCGDGQIALARATDRSQSETRAMSVTTETKTRQLQASPVPQRPDLLAARLDPSDPLLDAMAITRGRFAVGVEGERTLYLPAWAEVTRVIEDCR